MPVNAIIILVIGILSVSTASIFIRLCSEMPSLLIAFYRMFFSSLILISITSVKGKFTRYSSQQLIYGALGGLCLALHFATWISSIKYTSIASSVVIVATNPIWVALFSYLFFKEKQSKKLLAAIALSIIGSFVLAFGDSFGDLAKLDKTAIKGDLLALAGAITASLYFLNGSRMRIKMDVLPYTTLVYSFAALFLGGMVLFSGESFALSSYSGNSLIFLLLLAVVPQLIGHTSFNWALRYLKTSMVAVIVLGEPIGSAILAFIIFREKVSAMQLAGIALIFGAVLISLVKTKKNPV